MNAKDLPLYIDAATRWPKSETRAFKITSFSGGLVAGDGISPFTPMLNGLEPKVGDYYLVFASGYHGTRDAASFEQQFVLKSLDPA